MKKDGLLNVTMEAYDGAEACEFVGIFSLDKISVNMKRLASVYIMTNGLSVFKKSTWKNKIELTKNIQGLWFRKSGRI